MKKLALLLLVACGAHASQTPPPPPKPAAAPVPTPVVDEAAIASTDPLPAPFFYAATKGSQTVHFLGTVHVGVDPARLPKKVWDTLDAAKIFVMETDVGDSMAMMKKMMRSDGTTLDQELGPDYWAKFQKVVGAQLAVAIKGFKTSVAASILDIHGMPVTPAMDEELHKAAVAAGEKVAFLEAPDFQLALLDKWLDTKAVESELDHLDEDATESKQMLTAYVHGDEGTLTAETTDLAECTDAGRTQAECDQMNHDLLLDRNAAWVPQLEKMANDGDVFVAVGAAHLMGDKGVLGLLRARGWTVARVAP